MFKNWGENVAFTPREILRPTSVEEIIAIVAAARQKKTKIRVLGSAHSFSPLVATTETLVSLEKLKGLIEVNRQNNRATLWPGTTIAEMGPLLEPHGLAMANQGDIDSQSLAGALSTGTHGTGLDFASLAAFIHSLEFVDGTGSLQKIDESTPGDLLNAARVAMGTFGILTKVTLNLLPSFIIRDDRKRIKLIDCIGLIPSEIKSNRHFEFFWFPYSAFAQVKRSNFAETKSPRNPLIRFIADDILERAFFGILCEVTRLFQGLSATTSKLCGRLMPTASYSDSSYKVFPSPRHVKFTEMEYAVPIEKGVECFLAIKEFIEREKIKVFFPVEFRVSGPDPSWISSMYRRKSAIISIHVYKRIDEERYFTGAEEIFKKLGGRPHWGKMHKLSKEEIKQMHPRWAEFSAVRRTFDPDDIFLNEMLENYF